MKNVLKNSTLIFFSVMCIVSWKGLFCESPDDIHMHVKPFGNPDHKHMHVKPFGNPDDMLAYVKCLLPASPVILEAGGHYGEDTNRMKLVWPEATMHVFEPLPNSFGIMSRAVSHLSKVNCYPYALTTYSGTTNFYIDIPNDGASSIGFPVSWNASEFDPTPIQVSCTTLNEWVEMHGISHVDFMWLDMEGHELAALKNGTRVLETVKAIYTEISFVPVRVNSGLYQDLRCFLEECGFCEVWKSASAGRYGDALFVKKDLLHQ